MCFFWKLFILICATLSSLFFGNKFGLLGGIIGFPLGLILAFLIIYILNILMDLWYVWRPLRPICKNGKCKSNDYKWVTRIEDFCPVFICSCGDLYLKNGSLFIELLSDGSSEPYMSHSFFGRWKKDHTKRTDYGTYYPPKFDEETITKIKELASEANNPNIFSTITPKFVKD